MGYLPKSYRFDGLPYDESSVSTACTNNYTNFPRNLSDQSNQSTQSNHTSATSLFEYESLSSKVDEEETISGTSWPGYMKVEPEIIETKDHLLCYVREGVLSLCLEGMKDCFYGRNPQL